MKVFKKILVYSFSILTGLTLTACGETPNSESTHTHSYNAVVTQPTCTAEGFTTYTCDCGDTYTSDEVAALDHDYVGTVDKEATCTEEGNTHYVCKNDESHTYDEKIEKEAHQLVEHAAVEATCTATGNILYYSCEDCGNYFSDAAGANLIEDKTSVITAMLSHTLTHHEEVNSTCLVQGNIEYYTCDVCENYFSDAAGANLIEDKTSVVKDLVSHNLTKHDATDSTCVVAGNIEYYTCDMCDDYFADAAGATVIEDKASVNKELVDHTLGEWTIDSATFGGTATLSKKCGVENCDYALTNTHNVPAVYSSKVTSLEELQALFDVNTVTEGTFDNKTIAYTYTFAFENGVLSNTNQKKASSDAFMSLTAKGAGTLSFDVEVLSEYKYDEFSVYKNGERIYFSKDHGTSNDVPILGTITVEVAAGDVIVLQKQADSSGWGKDAEKNEVDYAKITNIAFSGSTAPANVEFVMAQFVTSQGNGVLPVALLKNQAALATLPAAQADGYVFLGWYLDDALAQPVTADYLATANVTLYAKFAEAKTLTIVYNDTLTANKVVEYPVGDLVTLDRPTYARHVFVGWYTTATFDAGSEWVNGSALNDNLTIYAKWEDAPAYANTYSYGYYSSYSSTSLYTNESSFDIVIDEYGVITGGGVWPLNGSTMSIAASETAGEYVVTVGTTKYRAFLDNASGILVMNYSSGATSKLNGILLFTPFETDITKDNVLSSGWNVAGFNARAVAYTYGENTYTVFEYNNTIYFNVAFRDAEGNTISAANASTAPALYVYDSSNELIEKFGCENNKMYVLDGKEGLYVSEDDKEVELNGISTITIDGVAGTYTLSEDNENFLTAYVDGCYYEITLNRLRSCTVVKPMVTLTYDTDGGSDVEQVSVNKNIELTLPSTSKDGYVFKGWEVSGSNVGSGKYTPTDNVTLKAVWAKLHDVTLVYNNGNENNVIKVENNTMADLPTPTKEGHIFLGWFTDENCSVEYADDITANTTLYAKWFVKPPYIGSYTGAEVYGSSDKGNYSAGKTLTINEELYIDGPRTDGTIDPTLFNSETGVITYKNGSKSYVVQYFNQNGVEFLVMNWTLNDNDPIGSDFFIFVKSDTKCSGSNADQYVWDGGKQRFTTLAFGDKKVTVYVNHETNTLIGNISLYQMDGTTPVVADNTNIKAVSGLVVKDVTGNVVMKLAKQGAEFVGLDGYQDVTYTGALGDILFDGAGNATVAGVSAVYVVTEENIVISYNDITKIVVVNKETATYTVSLDSTLGTYTNDGNTFVSNGDGTCTYNGEAGTYTFEGTKVTYTINGVSSTIVLNEDGTYSTKSALAGLTFTGTFYSEWDEYNSTLKIVFEDSTALSGTIYAGYGSSYYFNFNAVMEGNTITFTITKAIDSGAVNKTIVATLEGNKLTITSCGISNSAYSFDNQGTATCPDL